MTPSVSSATAISCNTGFRQVVGVEAPYLSFHGEVFEHDLRIIIDRDASEVR